MQDQGQPPQIFHDRFASSHMTSVKFFDFGFIFLNISLFLEECAKWGACILAILKTDFRHLDCLPVPLCTHSLFAWRS